MLLVLDASVIGKWFKEEIYSEIALKIRDNFVEGLHEIVVPDLLLYEISNAMRYDKKFDSEIIKKSIKSLLNMDIAITLPSEELLSEAIGVAFKRDITVYDAVYVALAKLIDFEFVTADEKLYKKIKDLKFVKFISEFKS